MQLPHFSLEAKPYTYEFRRRTTINVHMIDEPFTIDTQEGILKISPETCDDFADGYCVVYPSDGSKPYAMSRKYLADNYIRAGA